MNAWCLVQDPWGTINRWSPRPRMSKAYTGHIMKFTRAGVEVIVTGSMLPLAMARIRRSAYT